LRIVYADPVRYEPPRGLIRLVEAFDGVTSPSVLAKPGRVHDPAACRARDRAHRLIVERACGDVHCPIDAVLVWSEAVLAVVPKIHERVAA
jgi:hypothetical protein